MQKWLLTLVIWTLSAALTAQNKTASQLKKELAAHPQQDTVRVNLLLALYDANILSWDERGDFASQALSLSQRLNFPEGEGYALCARAFFELAKGHPKPCDSLLNLAENIASRIGNIDIRGTALLRKGQRLSNTGDKKGLEYLFQAEGYFEKSGNYERLSYTQRIISSFYQSNLSNYPSAMEYALKAFKSAEKSRWPEGLYIAWVTLGNLYALIGDNEKCITCFQNAREEIKKFEASDVVKANLANNLSEFYRLTGKYAEAIQGYKQALATDTSLADAGIYESNLADVYTSLDSLSLAFKHGFHAFAVIKQVKDDASLPWIYDILSRAYLKKNMPDSAIGYANSGLESAIQNGTIEYMRDNALALANAYAFKKDFGNAYRYHLQYINYRDSMLNTEVKNKTALLQYNNDMDKKQAQITRLNQQQKAQQNFLISALIVLSLILIVAALLFRTSRQRQKANRLLQMQKEQIDTKAKELSYQKDQVELSYNNMEKLGEIGRKITASLSVETIIGTVYNNVNALMDAAVFGIGIYNAALNRIDFPATFEEGKALPFYSHDIEDKNRFGPICFNSGKEIIIGNLHQEFAHHIDEVPAPHQGGLPDSIIFLPLVAREKKLGVITVQSFQQNAYSAYHLFMLRNIATYAAVAIENAEAFDQLNQTVFTLQTTQKQLIQSEKMASLGELTAGIAHEIQNPLNFVNNFSEVNSELARDLKTELLKGNMEEVNALANDIASNSEKIMHHGKRAEIIVKGMLQHSRSSKGIKESTDINALADEYLRLSYHGLRAKDKSFNSMLHTSYDETIGLVNIIPQDVGRVLLNLINNAFYAVDEKRKMQPGSYEPSVSVFTKKLGTHVTVSVEDTGNGIPEKVVDKIFQPFFTTKPAGQGTGLGLSLSYDIIKAHGGDITVTTKEGAGSTFIIRLPIN